MNARDCAGSSTGQAAENDIPTSAPANLGVEGVTAPHGGHYSPVVLVAAPLHVHDVITTGRAPRSRRKAHHGSSRAPPGWLSTRSGPGLNRFLMTFVSIQRHICPTQPKVRSAAKTNTHFNCRATVSN
jgi:hypothetical protein